jgi:chromosome segregation ATPase
MRAESDENASSANNTESLKRPRSFEKGSGVPFHQIDSPGSVDKLRTITAASIEELRRRNTSPTASLLRLGEEVQALQAAQADSATTISMKEMELHELEQKSSDLESANTALTDEIAALRAHCAHCEAQNAEFVMASANRLIHWATALQVRFTDFQAKENEKLSQVERDIGTCCDKTTKCVKVREVDELSELLEKAQSEFVSTMKEEQGKHEFELSEVVAKLHAAESQKRLLNDVLERERQESTQHFTIIEELGRANTAKDAELARSNQECAALKATIAELEANAARDRAQIGSLREEAIADQTVMRQCESRIEELAAQLAGSQQRCDEMCQSLADLRKEATRLNNLLAEKTEKLEAADAELARNKEVIHYQDQQLTLADLTFGNVKLMAKQAHLQMEAVLEEKEHCEQEIARLREENRGLRLGLTTEPMSEDSSESDDDLEIVGSEATNDSTDA